MRTSMTSKLIRWFVCDGSKAGMSRRSTKTTLSCRGTKPARCFFKKGCLQSLIDERYPYEPMCYFDGWHCSWHFSTLLSLELVLNSFPFLSGSYNRRSQIGLSWEQLGSVCHRFWDLVFKILITNDLFFFLYYIYIDSRTFWRMLHLSGSLQSKPFCQWLHARMWKPNRKQDGLNYHPEMMCCQIVSCWWEMLSPEFVVQEPVFVGDVSQDQLLYAAYNHGASFRSIR